MQENIVFLLIKRCFMFLYFKRRMALGFTNVTL